MPSLIAPAAATEQKDSLVAIEARGIFSSGGKEAAAA
jgi:hypothetical protein